MLLHKPGVDVGQPYAMERSQRGGCNVPERADFQLPMSEVQLAWLMFY